MGLIIGIGIGAPFDTGGGGGVYVDDLGILASFYTDDLGRPLSFYTDDLGRRL
jgi:hypothetical protein